MKSLTIWMIALVVSISVAHSAPWDPPFVPRFYPPIWQLRLPPQLQNPLIHVTPDWASRAQQRWDNQLYESQRWQLDLPDLITETPSFCMPPLFDARQMLRTLLPSEQLAGPEQVLWDGDNNILPNSRGELFWQAGLGAMSPLAAGSTTADEPDGEEPDGVLILQPDGTGLLILF